MKRIFPLSIALAALLLFSSCAAPAGNTINTTTVTTTPATTTTTAVTTTTTTTAVPSPSEPENTYRPDLRWGKATYLNNCSTPVNHTQEINLSSKGTEKIPCAILVTIRSESDGDEKSYQSFEPIEYFTSLGWEILPEDAWDYVNPVNKCTTVFVSPTNEAFAQFGIDELKALVEFYDLDQSLMDKGHISISFKQCSLKKTEA